MLNAVISWSIRRRHLVLAGGLALAVVGILAFTRLPIDAFPDTTPVQVQVNTTAPALSPLEIERQITFPVEQAISGLPGLHEVRSISKFGLSQVTVIFDERTNIYLGRQVVTERIQSVELPPGISRPQLGPVATGLGEVFHYLVTGPGHSLSELRTIQDWIIKPQMRSVPGVAEVNSWGGDERQAQVVVDPVRLSKFGITLAELAEALEQNNGNVGGGTIDQGGQASLVQGVGIVTSLADIRSIVIHARDGVPTRVGDVAQVVEGREIRHGAVTADGKSEVVLGLGFMLMGENSHEVTRRLKVRLDEVKKSLPAGVSATAVYDRTDLVDRVLHTVEENLLLGALLVVAIQFVFLGNIRAGLIVAAAIPLSMCFAFSAMLQVGIAGTLMSLGAIDFGLIVDSSVIMVENTVRRLGEDSTDRGVPEVVQEAAIEVRRPTMFGELIILIVYLPILALEGIEGKMFRPMAWTVIFALLGSLVLSFTLMPALCATFLKKKPERPNRLVNALRSAYRPALHWALARPLLVLGMAVFLLLNAAFLATRLGSEFVPRLREGAVVINTVRLAGVSVDESARYGMRIEQTLLDAFKDEIERVWTRTGTAEVATDAMGTEVSDVFVTLKPRSQWRHARTQDELVGKMQASLEHLPGMRMIFTQPIEMRVNEMVAGIRSDVGIKLFGDDLETLKTKAREIEALVREVPGAADVVTEQVTGQPMIQVEVNRDAVARHGIPAREVLDVVEVLGHREVGLLQDGARQFPIALTLDLSSRSDAVALGSALVTGANGERVPLSQLATVRSIEGPSTINREWGKRRVVVQANVRGRDVGSFVAEVRRTVDEKVSLPAGYYVRFGGQFEHLQRAQARLAIVVPLALALILGLLYLTFRRMSDVLRVFSGVPFAVVGGVFALWLRGLPFSISAAVGFIALSGVAVLNALVLVSTIRQNRIAGLDASESVEGAADRRLRPVLMTALVASVGFIPMALNTGIGAEVQRPLATVVIGGVITSTFLTLFVLPVLYAGRFRRQPAEEPPTLPLEAAG